jgi:hypothetical protein
MVGLASGERQASPRIEMVEFSIEPKSLPLGCSFEIRAQVEATDVPLGSFLLRTSDEVRKEDTIPGFPLYANGKYYMEEDGSYFLKDNGVLDQDPQTKAFALKVSTDGWSEGEYSFAFFASRRPFPGPFVAARHDFAVHVRNREVVIDDLGPSDPKRSRLISSFVVAPTTVEPGASVEIAVVFHPQSIQGVRLSNPFYIAADDTLQGFSFDESAKKSFYGTDSTSLIADNGELDRDQQTGCISLELPAQHWRSGVHHFVLETLGRSGAVNDERNFAIKVPSPDDQLDVHVGDSYPFMPGTHFGKFIKLRDGTLLCEDKYSVDQGRTWNGRTGGFGVGGRQLADGSVVGFAYKCGREKGDSGWYPLERFRSHDGGRSFQKDEVKVFVAEAKPAMGHGPYDGPIFMRSLVERSDKSLIALMAGWFDSDTAICPYGRGRPYSRSYVCESHDGGSTWRYTNTIGYAQLGSEGYNEGSMRQLPNGELLAVLRTGNERDFKCQDNPIMWSVSKDAGRTWSSPKRTGVEGAFPSLAVLSDGMVVMGYGRPGAMLVFSADHGRTWSDHTLVDATPYSGYTDVVEISPGELLVGFGARDYLDSATLSRSDQLRLARVQYK